MSGDLAARLRAALAGTPLAARLEAGAADFLERRGRDPLSARLGDAGVRGLARVLAGSPEAARFLARRTGLLERVADLDPGALERRADELRKEATVVNAEDLEVFLDGIRLLRREETVLAACLDLAGAVPFEGVSRFLSELAEAIVRRALAVAQERTGVAPGTLDVVAMGKLGSREFTYHSDLDLIFLYDAATAEVDCVSRTGQRLIAFLGTMTGAGIAYAVDARLRPSGHQGMLVSSLEGFTTYQTEEAQAWEHLALTRARAIAGDVQRTERVLAAIRRTVSARRLDPWPTIADLRGRIARERARESPERLAFKTGAGGIMDVEFLAAGGVLETGARRGAPPDPSVPAMLRHAVEGGRVAGLVAHYGLLRRVEARTRFVRGAAVESLPRDSPDLPAIAELFEPGLAVEDFWCRIEVARNAVREAIERVLRSGTIRALEG